MHVVKVQLRLLEQVELLVHAKSLVELRKALFVSYIVRVLGSNPEISLERGVFKAPFSCFERGFWYVPHNEGNRKMLPYCNLYEKHGKLRKTLGHKTLRISNNNIP